MSFKTRREQRRGSGKSSSGVMEGGKRGVKEGGKRGAKESVGEEGKGRRQQGKKGRQGKAMRVPLVSDNHPTISLSAGGVVYLPVLFCEECRSKDEESCTREPLWRTTCVLTMD
jgi:hypothetical protein